MADKKKKEKKNVMNKNPTGITRCYFCDGLIPDAELVTMPVPLVCKGGKVRNYKRKLHAKCSVKYSEKRKDIDGSMAETDDWNELYEYVRELAYGVGIPLPDFLVQRLQGLRVGKFIARATNRKLLERGYSYKTIHKTFMFSKPTIVNLLESQQFKDENHRINTMFYIINKNIPEIDRRIRSQESASKKLDSTLKNNNIEEDRAKAEYVKEERTVLPVRAFGSNDDVFDDLFD